MRPWHGLKRGYVRNWILLYVIPRGTCICLASPFGDASRYTDVLVYFQIENSFVPLCKPPYIFSLVYLGACEFLPVGWKPYTTMQQALNLQCTAMIWTTLNNDLCALMCAHFTFQCILCKVYVGDWGQSLFQLGGYDVQQASLGSDDIISRQQVNALDALINKSDASSRLIPHLYTEYAISFGLILLCIIMHRHIIMYYHFVTRIARGHVDLNVQW